MRDTQGWGTPAELVQEVAKRFRVSRPAAEVRLRELNHLPLRATVVEATGQ